MVRDVATADSADWGDAATAGAAAVASVVVVSPR